MKPINTDVVFWSHDHGTAKLIFKLQKDSIPQSLPEGTIVPICLEFDSSTAKNGRGRHIYHAEIVDALSGVISILLEDRTLGYVGRVDGSVYIELPDSRSLDTAGRFTFDIKRSPIDENVPELEDYYWQGFNEIMTQYHETIATIKLEAKTLLDSLTADVTKVKNDIATANTRIEEINQKIDNNDVFTKQETSANVIDQVIGNETSTRNITTDMKNKVATSVIENPNLAFTSYGATELFTPENGFETPQSSYDEVSAVDTRIFTLTRSEANKPSQLLISWDILTIAKKNLGEKFFFDNGAMDKASQIELLRKRLLTLSGNCIGFGSGPGGYKLNLSSWRRTDGTWQYRTPHTNATDTKISNTIGTASILAYIDEDGFYHNIIYAESCDGVTPSTIKVNYVSVEFTLSISANNHIESMIATNHVQNLATQSEAEAGVDELKTMTPKRVFQAIAKWTSNKFISLAGNDTILGIKNFTGNLLINSKRVLTVDDIVQASGTVPIGNGNTGTLKYRKQLNIVTLTFNSLNGRGGGSPSGSLITTLPAELMPSAYFEELIASTDRSTVNTAAISLGSNGEIRWQRNANTASDYSFDVTYQTN